MKYVKKSGGVVLAYTPEEREKALGVSLTSLAASLGYTPMRSGAHYILKEMDSLVIYNDKSWHRWSGKGNITGGSQIDFLLEFGGMVTVPEAIQELLAFKGEAVQEIYLETASKKDEGHVGDFELPPKNENYRRLYAYLIKTRGLSQEIVSEFVHQKLIYEEAIHHNIVYCGCDPQGNVRYAGLRGTYDHNGKNFKMDVPGNDKNYGVNIVNEKSSKLKVFESVIDCMSYIDMTGDRESNKLILGMVEDNPLVQFLKDYTHIKEITFCLDNDEPAQKAIYGNPDSQSENKRKGLKQKYQDLGYYCDVESPALGKDFNECLLLQKSGVDSKLQNNSVDSDGWINIPEALENEKKSLKEISLPRKRRGR